MWQIWIDTGGTFTDCIAVDPDGKTHRAKVLSSSAVRGLVASKVTANRFQLDVNWDLPRNFFQGSYISPLANPLNRVGVVGYECSTHEVVTESNSEFELRTGEAFEIQNEVEAPVLAAHWVTMTPLSKDLPSAAMRLATTRGTNALLELRGSPTALFITQGFGDLIQIGNQQRGDLFELDIRKAEPLYEAVVEVDERLSAGGEVVSALDCETIRVDAARLLDSGVAVAAVSLMHSYKNPVHELELSEFLLSLGFRHVSCSTQLAPLIKILPRTETAVVNAYLSDVIGDYLAEVSRALGGGRLHVLTSSGGLRRSATFEPKDSLLSGPAGGVVGAAHAAVGAGYPKSIAVDMGGTSTDVSRYDGDFDYVFETRVGHAHLLAPALAIETVAAGGGSICRFDGRQLKVGPQSAGANPGPACYGSGGPLTLTDINLLLGRLDPDGFEIPIDLDAAICKADEILKQVSSKQGRGLVREVVLSGFLTIANERMAEAIRQISIRKGYDPSRFALVAFGGAGGQHACALAETLGIRTILVPTDASLLSAVGLGRARVERHAERQVLRPLNEIDKSLPVLFEALVKEATLSLGDEGVEIADVEIRRRILFLRLAGQERPIEIHFSERSDASAEFHKAYQEHYGFQRPGVAVEVESARVVVASSRASESELDTRLEKETIVPLDVRRVYLGGSWRRLPVFQRHLVPPGSLLPGPCLVFETHCATLVSTGWTCTFDVAGSMILKRCDLEEDSEDE